MAKKDNVKIGNWGNSLGIRLPKTLLDEMGFKVDQELVIEKQGKKIVLYPKDYKITKNDYIDEARYLLDLSRGKVEK